MASTDVRPATVGDVDALAGVLARAFYDDPLSCFLFPGAKRRQAGLRQFFEIQLRRLYLGDGEVWTTADQAGAAVWAPPSKPRPTWRDLWHLAPIVPRLLPLGRALPDAARLIGEVERRRPRQTHWYLATLGIDPDHQRQGVGSALIGAVLARCDEKGLPAYLETSKEQNLAFYGRHRFEEVGDYVVRNGPRVWFMWREPRPAGSV